MQTIVCSTIEEVTAMVEYFQRSSNHVFGLDTESDQLIGSKNVSCLQIADDQRAYVIQLSQFAVIPKALVKWLQNSNYIKVGVDIITDCHRLWECYHLSINGMIDIKPLALALGEPKQSMDALGVKYLSHQGYQPTKGHISWKTPWSSSTLTDRQIQYAAQDAYWSLQIFKALIGQIRPVNYPQKEKEEETEEEISLDDFCQKVLEVLQTAKKGMKISSVANVMANSYGPLVRNYLLAQRKEKALEFIKMLVDQGKLHQKGDRIVINHPDTCKRLQQQVVAGNLQSVISLANYVADLNFRDDEGLTLLDLAIKYQRQPIIDYLRSLKFET